MADDVKLKLEDEGVILSWPAVPDAVGYVVRFTFAETAVLRYPRMPQVYSITPQLRIGETDGKDH